MRPLLPVLLLIPALAAAEAPSAAPKRKKFPAVALLPDGSQLHGVMFPQYDKNLQLSGVLKAEAMTLDNDETISGDTVGIEFYDPQRSEPGRVHLKHAVYHQDTGLLEAHETVTIRTEQFNANGTGLICSFDNREGFLLGPGSTWMNPDATKTTTMNSKSAPLRATAALGLSLLTLPLAAVPPQAVTEGEKTAIQADAASRAAEHAAAAKSALGDLRSDLDASAAATAAAKAFLEKSGTDSGPTATPVPAPPGAKPLDIKPGPTDSVVDFDGGMYFDAAEGVFVYLKNVRVNDPRFTLTGADEVKIFLKKKPETAGDGKTKEKDKEQAKKDKDKPGMGLGAKFDGVDRVVATGAVLLTQKEPEKGKEPVQASGAIFTYHPESGEIILSGGYPWVKQGTYYSRAMEPNLVLRVFKTGSFVTEGNWQMGGHIELKK